MPQHIMAILHYFEVIQWHTGPIRLWPSVCWSTCLASLVPRRLLNSRQGLMLTMLRRIFSTVFQSWFDFKVCAQDHVGWSRSLRLFLQQRILSFWPIWTLRWGWGEGALDSLLYFLSPLIKHTSLLTKRVNYVDVRLCIVYCKKTVNYCGNCLTRQRRECLQDHISDCHRGPFLSLPLFSKVSNLCSKTKTLSVWW